MPPFSPYVGGSARARRGHESHDTTSPRTAHPANPNDGGGLSLNLASRLSIILSLACRLACRVRRIEDAFGSWGLAQTSRTLLSRIAMCRLKAFSTRRGARAGGDRHFCVCLAPLHLIRQGTPTGKVATGQPGEGRLPGSHDYVHYSHTHLTRRRGHCLVREGAAALCEREGRSYHITIT